jgi:hypothetical protein
MSATVLEHPLVRDYLRRLDAACAALPAAQARELRDQIIAHLDEALPPDAAGDEVAAELDRLGTPAELAAEATGPGPRSPGARLRARLARLRWWTWTSIAVVVAVLATGAGYVIAVQSAASLSQGGLSTWWYPQDADRGVQATTIDGTQMSVPERFNQQQGFVIGIYNESDWTQTIEGVDANSQIPTMPITVSAGVGPADADADGGYTDQTRWVLPAPIGPHSYRVIRVLWTSGVCQDPGGNIGFTSVALRVRVGPFTRTEDVPFVRMAFVITGTKTSAPASICDRAASPLPSPSVLSPSAS